MSFFKSAIHIRPALPQTPIPTAVSHSAETPTSDLLSCVEYPMRKIREAWIGLGHSPAMLRVGDLHLHSPECLICAALDQAGLAHRACVAIPDPHLWTADSIGVRVTTTMAGHALLGQLAAWGAQRKAMPPPALNDPVPAP
jgi:hypothetical protein